MDAMNAITASELARLCVENPDLPVVVIPRVDEHDNGYEEQVDSFASRCYVGKVIDGRDANRLFVSGYVRYGTLGYFDYGLTEYGPGVIGGVANRILFYLGVNHRDEPDFDEVYRPIARMMAEDLPWFDAIIISGE